MTFDQQVGLVLTGLGISTPIAVWLGIVLTGRKHEDTQG